MITRIKKLCSEYVVELMVAVYLLYRFYLTAVNGIYSYVSVWYALDYSYGFGSRLMIGSFLHAIAGDYIERSFAENFIRLMLVVLCLLLAVFAGMVYRSAKDTNVRLAIAFLTAFYLASPASPEYLWTAENMGRLETFLFINSLIIAFVYFKVKNDRLKYLLFLVIGIFTVSIHQIYFLLFFPSMLIMLIEDLWDNGLNWKRNVWPLLTAAGIGAAFLYMQFGSGVYYDNVDDLFEALSQHTNLPIGTAPLEAEYFWTIKDHFYNNQLPELRQRVRFGFITVVMLAPIWGTYLHLWRQAIKSKTTQAEKWKYRLMLLTNVAYVPVFALMTDWGRWFAAFFVVAFLNVMVLTCKKDAGMLMAVEKLGRSIRSYGIVFLVFILYVSTFEKFEGINYLQQVMDFYYITYDCKEWLLGLF